jgi:hypothetical protein
MLISSFNFLFISFILTSLTIVFRLGFFSFFLRWLSICFRAYFSFHVLEGMSLFNPFSYTFYTCNFLTFTLFLLFFFKKNLVCSLFGSFVMIMNGVWVEGVCFIWFFFFSFFAQCLVLHDTLLWRMGVAGISSCATVYGVTLLVRSITLLPFPPCPLYIFCLCFLLFQIHCKKIGGLYSANVVGLSGIRVFSFFSLIFSSFVAVGIVYFGAFGFFLFLLGFLFYNFFFFIDKKKFLDFFVLSMLGDFDMIIYIRKGMDYLNFGLVDRGVFFFYNYIFLKEKGTILN